MSSPLARRQHLRLAHPRQKLTPRQVLEIRRVMREAVGSAWAHAKVLAPQYQVHPATIMEILKRHSWVKLPACSPLVLAMLLFAGPAYAQIDPCAQPQPPFTVTSGAPFSVSWVLPPDVVVAGFYTQIDTQPRQRTLATLIAGQPCVTGPNIGWIPYTLRTQTGVPRGTHTFTITAFNFAVDPITGSSTTTEQESVAVAVPFDGADPPGPLPPPPPVANVIIRR